MKTIEEYKTPFTPVDPDFTDIIISHTDNKDSGKVHFFNASGQLDTLEGTIGGKVKKENGEFLLLDSNESIRIDRIITILGRPGPAYDEYDRYGNACLTCEDLGQFGA